MGYRFPDVREAFYRLIPRAVDPAPKPYFRLEEGWEKLLSVAPAALIYRVGGDESGPFRMDRIEVQVYAEGSTQTHEIAEEIRAFLAGSWHDADGILLDSVDVEVIPTEIPYMSATVNLVSTTYRVATRAA